jgi:hypothetical protein
LHRLNYFINSIFPQGKYFLASIPIAFPISRPEEAENNELCSSEAFSIILALNQESMLIDPVQWENFKPALLGWGEKYCTNLEISKVTDNLFNERIPLTHPHRARQVSWTPPPFAYHFFDPRSTPVAETNHLVSCGIPVKYSKMIHKINSHNRVLSMIGILPNQIRSLFKSKEQGNLAFEELSRELFWKGYAIWKKRKRLMANFWKNIAPNEWKKYNGRNIQKNNKVRKKHKCKIEKKEYQCQNPFHFLKKHCDLSHKLPTPCSCSQIWKKAMPHRFLDLTSYFAYDNFNLTNTESFTTREDLVRGEHDRGKKASTHDRIRLNLTD